MSDNESNGNDRESDGEQPEGVEETKGDDIYESEDEDTGVEDNGADVEDNGADVEVDDDKSDDGGDPDDDAFVENNFELPEADVITEDKSSNIPTDNAYQPFDDVGDSDESESESEEDEYIAKVDLEKKIEYIKETHTQEISKTYEEMIAMARIKRKKSKTDGEDIISDDKHTTVPILTKYEKTRVLGIRVSQLNEGAPRYINIGNEQSIIDNNIIAEKELRMKKLPFIISRPLPNGDKEHWRLKDLEIL